MAISIDPQSSEPIYMQILESVQRLVATGELKPGDQLPTVRQLAVELRVNPNTVARAYLELDRGGIISTQQGRGTYVTEQPDGQALARRREDRLRELVSRFLLGVLSQGYQAAEVRAMLEQELEEWRTEQAQRTEGGD